MSSHEVFNERELAAIKSAVVSRGKRKGQWKKTGCPYGSDGYIVQQARTTVFNPFRMPSEFVLLFNDEQSEFFWGLVGKFDQIRNKPDVRKAAERQVQESMS